MKIPREVMDLYGQVCAIQTVRGDAFIANDRAIFELKSHELIEKQAALVQAAAKAGIKEHELSPHLRFV